MEPASVKVRDRMTLIGPMSGETTVIEATEAMKVEGVNVVPIGNSEQIAGTISTRDIALAASKDSGDISQVEVQDILSQATGFCTEDDSLSAAVKTMRDYAMPTLLVRNAEGAVTGTISLTDVFLEEDHAPGKSNPALARQAEDPPVRSAR